MAEKCINFYTNTPIDCPSCFPTDAILCLPTELVLSGKKTIEAVLINSLQQASNCNGAFYKYTFTYDDELLVADTVLRSEDILGAFCKNCLTDWIEDLIGD